MSVCPICGCEKSSVNIIDYQYLGECPVCGYVNCDATFIDEIVAGNIQKHIVSGIFRQLYNENRHKEKKIANAQELLDMVTRPQNPMEQIDRILIFLYKNFKSMTNYITIDPKYDYPLAFATGDKEMASFLKHLFDSKLVNLEGSRDHYSHVRRNDIVHNSNFCLTIEGYEKAQRLQDNKLNMDKVFVAMWFTREMTPVYKNAIEPAISACNFKPMRIDKKEHNNKIDDEILEEIEDCKFMIADFTGQRGGVYFEAGYAKALKKEVIFTCKASESKEVHFDTNHFNYIFWKDEEDLKVKLIKRISESIKS
ncbi:MAG: hypothetical protein P9L97_02630 [Candidatus Tenebribacter davisii]|nr:hypothetical protein [Candidatus Tenebribacter davisii]